MLNAPFQDASNEDLGLKAENIWAFPTNVSSSSFKDYLSTDAETALNADIPLLFVAFPSAKDPKWSSYPGISNRLASFYSKNTIITFHNSLNLHLRLRKNVQMDN